VTQREKLALITFITLFLCFFLRQTNDLFQLKTTKKNNFANWFQW